jgi:hypothetical protein
MSRRGVRIRYGAVSSTVYWSLCLHHSRHTEPMIDMISPDYMAIGSGNDNDNRVELLKDDASNRVRRSSPW